MASAMASIVALKDLGQQLKVRMDKTIEDFRGNLMSTRTGRASVHMLDQIKIDYYGNTQQVLSGATTVQICIYKNYGRPNEEKIEVTRRLKGVKDVLDLAEVSFP